MSRPTRNAVRCGFLISAISAGAHGYPAQSLVWIVICMVSVIGFMLLEPQ